MQNHALTPVGEGSWGVKHVENSVVGVVQYGCGSLVIARAVSIELVQIRFNKMRKALDECPALPQRSQALSYLSSSTVSKEGNTLFIAPNQPRERVE